MSVLLIAAVMLGPSATSGATIPSKPFVEYELSSGGCEPSRIAAGPDGNLWFTEWDGNKVGRITPQGVVTEFPLPTPNSQPWGICAGPDGNMWFTEYNPHQIGKITPAGNITEYIPPYDIAGPCAICAAVDGTLWYTNVDEGFVTKIRTDGTIVTAITTGSACMGICTGPDGNIWITDSIGVIKMTPAGHMLDVYTLAAGCESWGICPGPDGNLWCTDSSGQGRIFKITTSGAVTEYPVPTTPSQLMGICQGSDGNLWFANGVGEIGCITPGGDVTAYEVPTYNSGPCAIAAGPDGNLWFTEHNVGKIGRFLLAGWPYGHNWTGGHDVIGATSPSSEYYFAEGTCRPNFDPYICIQNPDAADAAVTITYMKGDGSTESQSLTVTGRSRSTVRVKDELGEGDDSGHDFSSKVECTNGREIIAERPMYFNYGGAWTGGHDVIGATSPSSVYYFAEGTCRPNFDPYICIQNPGAADAAVAITYMKGDGSTASQNLVVGGQSRSTVKVKDTLGEGDDPAHDFSSKVECAAGREIIVERPMYFNYQGYTQLNWTGGHDVIGITAPDSTFYFAEGTARPLFDPYICVQNPGGADAAVTITYMKGDGTTSTQDLSVKKHSRSTVKVKDVLGEGDDPAHDFSSKVECTNGQEIIAERPMYFNYQGYTQLNWTGGHDVIGATAPASTFYFAEGTARPFFDPYLCIQNPGGTDAEVTITYMKGDGSTDTQSLTVKKHSRSTVKVKDRLGEGNDPAHDFSSKVECTNGQEIIVERPMYFKYGGD
ncbi:MAG: hypothetical protein V1748_03785 [Actinomycetota bacterium]